jgi:hypothetical protein
MPATSYKIWTVGAAVGQGVTGSIRVQMAAVAKKATAAQPYIVANEMICSALARILLLPCPPGAITEHNNEPYFVSLDFNLVGMALPPAPAAKIATDHSFDTWGIIVFDVWVMNGDRHASNLAYDVSTKKLQIFDHSHALLNPAGDISARLTASKDELAIGGHCLANEIATMDGLQDWTDRVRQVPNYFIDGLVDAAEKVGLPAGSRTEVKDFLKARRDNIATLIANKRASFAKLPQVVP